MQKTAANPDGTHKASSSVKPSSTKAKGPPSPVLLKVLTLLLRYCGLAVRDVYVYLPLAEVWYTSGMCCWLALSAYEWTGDMLLACWNAAVDTRKPSIYHQSLDDLSHIGELLVLTNRFLVSNSCLGHTRPFLPLPSWCASEVLFICTNICLHTRVGWRGGA